MNEIERDFRTHQHLLGPFLEGLSGVTAGAVVGPFSLVNCRVPHFL